MNSLCVHHLYQIVVNYKLNKLDQELNRNTKYTEDIIIIIQDNLNFRLR